jgi:cytochrome c biogenesis protein CcmG/thiol:disulfide interchange protein DsbE
VLTGGTFDISQLRGPFVVVDFFSSWCVPCRTEQPQLVKSAEDQRYGADLVGVIFEDTVPYIRALLGPWVGLYPVITDPGGQGSLNCGVDNPPSKYVIDPNGTVVAKIIGPVTATGLDSIIARARSERL